MSHSFSPFLPYLKNSTKPPKRLSLSPASKLLSLEVGPFTRPLTHVHRPPSHRVSNTVPEGQSHTSFRFPETSRLNGCPFCSGKQSQVQPISCRPPPQGSPQTLPPSSGEWGSRGGGKGGAACWPVQISARRWDFAHFAHPCSQLPAHVAWPSCRHPSGSIVPDGLVSVFRGDPGWILAFLGDWNWEESPLAFHQSWVQISF